MSADSDTPHESNITDRPEFPVMASVDLGSNSFHMIVARMVDGNLQIIDRLREMVRLAAGLDEKNNITPEAEERALACLRRFGQRLANMPLGSVRVVGTNTLRKAHNARQFIREATLALGHPIEIIAGREEARLLYLGVSHSVSANEGRQLVIDIGGGSTECIIGEQFEPRQLESLHMGCVSFSQSYFRNGEIREKNYLLAEYDARLELQPIKALYKRLGWERAIGASGTVRAIAAVAREMEWCSDSLTREAMHKVREALLAVDHMDDLDLKGLKEERRAVFAGGFAVLMAIFEELDIEAMQVSDWALREGLLYDLFGRIRLEDVRERTINALYERFDIDQQQAQWVEGCALKLLKQVAETWDLTGNEQRQLLSWAARLHEIGLGIAHSQYHKHGGYLLTHSDLPGFSVEEQRTLAALVRSHRRKFPQSVFMELPSHQRRSAERLSLLLRIAALLHRDRTETQVPKLKVKAHADGISLKFPDGWLEEHPLTVLDLKHEVEYLEQSHYQFSFS